MTKAIKWLCWWNQGNKNYYKHEWINNRRRKIWNADVAVHSMQPHHIWIWPTIRNWNWMNNFEWKTARTPIATANEEKKSREKKTRAHTVYSSASTSDYWLLFGLITLCAMHLEYTAFFAYLMASKWESKNDDLKCCSFSVACEKSLSAFNFQFVNEINKHLVNDANAYSSNVHIRQIIPYTQCIRTRVCFLFEFSNGQSSEWYSSHTFIFVHSVDKQRSSKSLVGSP